MSKAILVIDFDDEWLDRINTTFDEMFTDVTIYKKESLENQCDYSQRIYRCWCPLKPMPMRKMSESVIYANGKPYSKVNTFTDYDIGWNECIDFLEEEE